MIEFIVFVLLLIAAVSGNTYGLLSTDLTTFLLFVLVVGLLIYRDRAKVKFEGIVFIRRTQKGRNFIDKVTRMNPRFWKILAVIGVVVTVPTLFLGSAFLANQALSVASGAKEGGVRLLLPGPVSSPQNLPGVFVVPWWIWIIGVAAVIIPHEFMHGIMCRLDKIKIKSVGWILLLVIPGAFVEPDENQLKRAKRSTKMKVYAAGSFANIIVALIVLAVLALYFFASFTPAGVFVQTLDNSPANLSGLSGSITEIDGFPVRQVEDIRDILSNYQPGDVVEVKTAGGNIVAPSFRLQGVDFLVPKPVVVANTTETRDYTITLAEHPERGTAYLGVAPYAEAVFYSGGDFAAYATITTLLLWIYVFSLGIGIVNILPIKPLDGGLLFEELVGRFTKRTQFVVRTVSGIMLLVLVFNLVGPYLV